MAITMSKKVTQPESRGHAPSLSNKAYKDTLCMFRVGHVKLQRHFIECNDRILIILEGRDASGKDGTIKRIVQHLSPRETRVVALGKPPRSSCRVQRCERCTRISGGWWATMRSRSRLLQASCTHSY